MNISVNVDCTPEELRAFLGLPDVAPMQNAVMEDLERRMLEAMDQMTPTTMMKEWFTPSGAMYQSLLSMFQASMKQSSGDSKRSAD